MADLTYLNDAAVLHNLRQRYYAKLIYVSVSRSDFTNQSFFFSRSLFLSISSQKQIIPIPSIESFPPAIAISTTFAWPTHQNLTRSGEDL